MLYSVDTDSEITKIPHIRDYERWCSQLTDAEYNAIYNELMSRISGSEIETSSWIPGSDWTGTVFQPIYEKACNQDENASAKYFGLILWHVVMEHDACCLLDVISLVIYRLMGLHTSGLVSRIEHGCLKQSFMGYQFRCHVVKGWN